MRMSSRVSEGVNLHRRWVTESLSEIASYLVLGRKIDLLEQLRRDGQAARGPDLPQRIVCIMVAVEVVAWMHRISLRAAPRGGQRLPFEKSFSSGPPALPWLFSAAIARRCRQREGGMDVLSGLRGLTATSRSWTRVQIQQRRQLGGRGTTKLGEAPTLLWARTGPPH